MNLYESHPLMIDSGTFWRCDHGETGWFDCWRCGLKHPKKLLASIKAGNFLRDGEYEELISFLHRNETDSIYENETLSIMRKVANSKV